MKKNLIVGGVMFVAGFLGVQALKQVGITPIGEDGEINWLLMVALAVSLFVIREFGSQSTTKGYLRAYFLT